MKILSYQKKEFGSMIGVVDVEVLMDYGIGPQPIMIRCKHFRSSKSGKEWIAFPAEKNWDSEEKKYEDVVKFQQEGARFPFSEAVMTLLNDYKKETLPDMEVDDQDFPF